MKQAGELVQRVMRTVKKYKYVALVLLLGIALLLIPGKKSSASQPSQTHEKEVPDDEAYRQELEERLSVLLTETMGAGNVKVMLTLRTGTQIIYQTDTSISTDTSDGTSRTNEERKTVILSEGSAYDEAATSAVEYPLFQGAVVVCEGADDPSVKLGLINAVAALTGLRSDQITVLKMK